MQHGHEWGRANGFGDAKATPCYLPRIVRNSGGSCGNFHEPFGVES
jgi:hypothetical protein